MSKGQVNLSALQIVTPIIIILIVLALVLFTGGKTLETIETTQDINDQTQTITNESITATAGVEQLLNNLRIDNATVTVFNNTNALPQSDWEMSSAQATDGLINITNTIHDTISLNVTYSFSSDINSLSLNATRDGLSGLTTFSGFQPTFAVVLVLIVLVGLLLGGFMAFTRMGRL